jgi:uncharacterized membrane protein YkoI
MRKLTTLLLLLPPMLVATGHLLADSKGDDHDRAYQARQEEKILSLEEILGKLDLGPDTRLLEVEHEQEDGRDIYEIEYLTNDGDIYELEVDAATGQVLKQERE